MREPRSWRMASSSNDARSRALPSAENKISPEIRACGGSSRMMASDVTDFPEPDSPTSPRTSPGLIEKLRSRTAGRNEEAGTAVPGGPAVRTRSGFPRNPIFRWRSSSSAGTSSMLAAGTPSLGVAGEAEGCAYTSRHWPKMRGKPFFGLPTTTTFVFGLLAKVSVASIPFHSNSDGVIPWATIC